MEEKQPVTSRKRKRFDWWAKHAPKKGKVVKKSEKPLKETPEKKKQTSETSEDEKTKQTIETPENEDKNKRYILFVGNLPFSVKEEQVKNHFRCTDNIKEFRLMTKKTGESKGCGFIEFNDKTSFSKALNLHHSVLAGRKINVEITCGGGGKGEQREKRLQERKLKFRQGRKRRSKTTTKVKLKQKDDTSSNK